MVKLEIVGMKKILSKYLAFILKYKWKFLFYTGLIIVWAVLSSISPYFYKLFIDALTVENFNQVWQVFRLFVDLSLTSIIISQVSHLAGDWLLIPVIEDSRILVFKKIQELDFAFHTEKTTGSLISADKSKEWQLPG
jgi:ABC-type multidrug transport system fused ATPase/permease subunit